MVYSLESKSKSRRRRPWSQTQADRQTDRQTDRPTSAGCKAAAVLTRLEWWTKKEFLAPK